jgi:mono/diheme cytochrome c family protein
MAKEFRPIEIGGKSIENRILIGLATLTATIILIGWIAINENARMTEFTERAQGRSIEAGARLWEANCTSCHGKEGYGLAGVAPALNNPVLFGYNFFRDLDNRAQVLESELAAEADPARRDALRAELALIEAERLALEEKILYDWSDRIAELDAQIAAVDERVLALGGVDNASRLPVYISQREAQELAPLLAERDDLAAKVGEGMPAEGEPRPGLTAEEDARLTELEAQIAALEAELQPYRALADERADLVAKRGRFQAVVTAQEQIENLRAQLAEVESQIAALGEAPAEGQTDRNAEKRAELDTQARDLNSQLDSLEVTRQDAYDALVERLDIVPYDPNGPSRLQQVGWSGTLYDYLEGTLIGGRPTSSSYWPQPMAAWAQTAGGPLRTDQIKNLVDFIINYGAAYDRMTPDQVLAEIRRVQQFSRIPVDGSMVSMGAEAIGTDNMVQILADVEAGLADGTLMVGDASLGQTAFQSYGCAGCHGAAAGTGPALTGMWARAVNNEDGRLTSTGYDAQGYIIHSIAQPNAYIVGGYAGGIMPQNFTTDQMSYQDLVHILAYIQSK